MEANQEAQSAKADVRMWDELGRLSRAGLVELAVGARDQAGKARGHYLQSLRRAHDLGASVSELAAALGISRTAVYKQLGKKEGR